jgi:thiamine-monophosphate kinase
MPDDPGERSIIDALLEGRPRVGATPVLDVGDDVAVLPGGLAIGADTMVEGVHWDDKLSPADVGWKLVAVNASDLGATGARPSWCTLSLSLPRPLDLGWAQAFAAGLHAALAAFGVRLIGGDTTRSPGPRVAALTMGGSVARPVGRAGGPPGDLLLVTGTLGDAAAGFAEGGPGLAWLRRPVPPVSAGVALAESGLLHAMMDLSDGLYTDLSRLCAASACGATVDAAALPASPQVAASPRRLHHQVAWGDDYQLLLAAPAERLPALRRLAGGTALTPIGRLDAAAGLRLAGADWPAPALHHFGEPPAC